MSLILLLGGARSGKSRLAQAFAGGERPVTLIATAEAGDEEMARRIEEHRMHRPAGWTVIEEPLDLGAALARVEPQSVLIVDCLTLWVSNLMGSGLDDDAILEQASSVAESLAERGAPTVVVSNEVGSGIVPLNALARRYRDLLGIVNAAVAEAADRVYLTVAGGVVPVQSAKSVLDAP